MRGFYERPPFVAGSDTSEAAAGSVEGLASTLRRRVWERIRGTGMAGMTCDEVEARLGLRHQTASARIRELAVRGLLADSGRRAATRSGRQAVVWVAQGG